MPLFNGDYPPYYKISQRGDPDKVTEIANEMLKTTGNGGKAIATGLNKPAHFKKESKEKDY